jgi:hypothetical protein
LIDDRFLFDDFFWLFWFGRDFEVSTALQQSPHIHLLDNCFIEVLVSLHHPLRSRGAESLSSAISAGAWTLNEHDRVCGLERSLPIIDWMVWVD